MIKLDELNHDNRPPLSMLVKWETFTFVSHYDQKWLKSLVSDKSDSDWTITPCGFNYFWLTYGENSTPDDRDNALRQGLKEYAKKLCDG